MTPPSTPNKSSRRAAAEYYPGSSHRLIELAVQIRICDLLTYLKRPRERVSGISFTLNKIQVEAKLDLSDLERPIVAIRTAVCDGEFGEPQVIPLHLRHAPLGGWTADFRCPLKQKDGTTCGRRVQSLYLPEPWADSLFGCRRCHRLEYACRARRKLRYPRAWKRRKKTEKRAYSSYRRRRSLEPIPPVPPEAEWFDEIQYTDEEVARIKLYEAIRSNRAGVADYRKFLNEIKKMGGK